MRPSRSIEEALLLTENDPSKVLRMIVDGKELTKGEYLPRKHTQNAPKICFPNSSSTVTYAVVCVDIDPPFPSWSVLGAALHWLRTGLTATVDGEMKHADNIPALANYMGAGPPPGSSPHRYLFILYEQGPGFDINKWGRSFSILNRMRFDLDKFETDTGLGKIVAATYFLSN
ncbi:hypothetical protein P175DRAFT_0439331 [Aspergillus ochraceoroseus IBT 24754]|uniref:Protease inhibitor (Tfs1) n=2 Tax=Aspergillus subgen. Nidulantes TaxID=2720870 RepID=A0A0F8WC81_9EURO|nr:uncharacterized protein P175DRAFT_0439331 [Aspergillus ochraceoroseus IBT 24754]KKK15460.1 hypothetical protein ARAM_005778 [Aspergillus rambellii]PTU19929.1 hypothetical protein P175DRAFT_0439331 [Aspergillus ochraceoroseus IBT 24754]